MIGANISKNAELKALILRVYPWWEMQRVRELAVRSKTPNRYLSNAWRHTPGLIDHNYRGVTTPNCDTLYSGAWLDLADGPILIEVPATELPYWSIAIMDLNTDNIAIMGNRYPDSYRLLVCGQDYQGVIPDGVHHVRSSSQIVWLLARYLIGNDDLVAQAEDLRQNVRLGRWQDNGSAVTNPACPQRVTPLAAERGDPKNFWHIIRRTLDEDDALHGSNRSDIQKAWPIGVTDWNGLESDFQQHFTDAFHQVLQSVTANNSGNMQTRGQWRYPGSDIGNFGDNMLYRAEVSLWGLGALPVNEVIYVSAIAEEAGQPLQGINNYRFRIPPEGIPVEAFWSLTMYEVDPHGGMYFTANPLKRYAVGDRTEGLAANPDGSIDIWISHTQPAERDQLDNWLPAPKGVFRLMIRAYAPSEQFQSGLVRPPPVQKIN